MQTMNLDCTRILIDYIRASGKAQYIIACSIAWLEDSLRDPVLRQQIIEQFGTRLIENCKEYSYE